MNYPLFITGTTPFLDLPSLRSNAPLEETTHIVPSLLTFPSDSQGRKRYRGKMRVIAVNDSEILANFHQELMETNSDKFKIYEDHICDVVSS